jgi:hypothetical protein
MATLPEAISRHTNLLQSVGEATLHAMFPSDFEYYQIAFELVTSNNKTIDYFSFPVLPQNISVREPQLTNIKKTAKGIVSLSTNTFVPKMITMKGDFGRRFKLLLRDRVVDFSAFKFSGILKKENIQGNLNVLRKAAFDPAVKSGYGCLKILQSILDKSTGVDDNNSPFKLFFYNPVLGDNYLVEVIDFDLNMSMDRNRIGSYSVQLKAIAPLENLVNFNNTKSMIRKLTIDNLQKGANTIVNSIRRSL